MTTNTEKKRKATDCNNLSGPPTKRRSMQIPTLDKLTFEETRKLGQKLVQSSHVFLERGPLKPRLNEKETNWEEVTVNCSNSKQNKKAKDIYRQELRDHEVEAKKKIESELELKSTPVPWNEDNTLALIEKHFQSDIKKDEELNGYYERDIRGTMDSGILDFLVRNLRFQFGRNKRSKVPFARSLMKNLKNPKYEPPTNRIALATMGTIARIWKHAIYLCDIPESNLSTFRKELVFKHIDKNFVDEKKYPELVKFTKKAESENYVIKCSCCKEGNEPIVPCWENPNCQCFKVNQQLQKMQYETNEGHKEATNFHTFRPKLVSDLDYSHTIGFACSELCGCKGRCDNNVTLIPEKGIFPLEVFRRNADMGFAIRTTVAIPAGTLVKEFTGELMDGNLMGKEDEDYAYALTTQFRESIKQFQKANSTWDETFKEELKTQLSNTWYINPKRKGNIGRHFSHSCFPNLSAVQVYQKGFSPAHCKLFMATQRDVFPGVELTFNYGTAFLEQQIGNECLCNSIACKNTPGFKQFAKLSDSALKSFCAIQHYDGFLSYQKIRRDGKNASMPSK